MVEIVTINWMIGGLATLLILYSVYITFKASKKLAGELKTSILLIVSALLSLLFMGLGTGIMAVKDIDYNANIWLIIPSLSLLGAVLFLIGAKKLFKILFQVSGNGKGVKKLI